MPTLGHLDPGQVRLFDRAEAAHFEFGADWFRLLADTARHSEGVIRLCTEGAADAPKAMVPLLARPERRELGALSNWYTTLYAPLLAEDAKTADLAALFRRLRLEPGRWRSLRLSPMDPESPAYALTLEALRQAGWLPYPFFIFGNWYLPVGGRSYDVYAQSLPSPLRHTLKRKTGAFYGGEGRLELITGEERLEAGIQDWLRVYQASWKMPEPSPDFVPGLIRLCARRGWLRLGLAYWQEQPVAAQLWIVQAGRASIYKLAQDQRHDELSPGTVLTAYLMQHVLDVDRVTEVDFLIGDESYKQDWMPSRRERWGLIAYNPATLAGLANATWQAGWNLAKQVAKQVRRSLG